MKRLVVLAIMCHGSPALAQQTEPDPKIPIEEVKLAVMPEWFPTGKTATYRGEVDADGVGFRLAGLTMRTPVAVTVIGVPTAPIKLSIGKSWTTEDRKVDTTTDSVVLERFRTDDEALIRIRSLGDRRPFELIIWVGDERTDYPDEVGPIDFGEPARAKGPAPAPVPGGSGTPAPASAGSQAPAATPGSPPASTTSSPVMWVIAGLLAVIVLLFVIVLLRRKR